MTTLGKGTKRSVCPWKEQRFLIAASFCLLRIPEGVCFAPGTLVLLIELYQIEVYSCTAGTSVGYRLGTAGTRRTTAAVLSYAGRSFCF